MERPSWLLILRLLYGIALFPHCGGLVVTDFQIQGQIARLYEPADVDGKNHRDDDNPRRPLIVLPGMAQTIATWDSCATMLAKNRRVLVCEVRGIGLHPWDGNGTGDSSNNNKNVTLPFQAESLHTTLHEIFTDDSDHDSSQSFDFAGFSLGGRVAMAYACLYPEKVNSLHLTGVAWQRSIHGQNVLLAWENCLAHDNLHGFAWLAILHTYSPRFVHAQKDRVALWVDSLSQSHTSEGLLELMRQTHHDIDIDNVEENNNMWTVPGMAEMLMEHEDAPCKGHICIGQEDEMAPIDEAKHLAKRFNWEITVISDVGHAVPFESPRLWRESVLHQLERVV